MEKGTTVNPLTGDMEIPEDLRGVEAPTRRHEALAVVISLVALFLVLSLVSYSGSIESLKNGESGNIMGTAGEWTAHFVFALLGLTAYLLDGFLWVSAICLFSSRVGRIKAQAVLGILFVVIFSSIALHTALCNEQVLGHYAAGGFLGEILGEILISIVSTAGTYLISLGGIIVVMLLVTDISLVVIFRSICAVVASGGRAFAIIAVRVLNAWKMENPETDDCKKPIVRENISFNEEEDVDCENVDFAEPKIVTTVKKARKTVKKAKIDARQASEQRALVKSDFQLPSVELLTEVLPDDGSQSEIDETYLKGVADHLVQILADFGITGEVREIHPGPVVTMFEFQPKSGTKLSKIEGLSNEIAMALEVLRVRVVAPIPGKNAVGFELPNKTRETVYLKELISDDGFNNSKNKLPLSLGKDISGIPYFVDLAKMPHLLIAGTTGSGKSVSLNVMLMSLLYKYTPDDLRLLLVDPKMIELGSFDGIPHLLLPVVKDMSKACLALKWAVDEMERRYQLFADLGVRNIASYNVKVERIKKDHFEKSDDEKEADSLSPGYAIEEDEVVAVASAAQNVEKLEKLPFIVIVVDELSDLMMVAAKDVETSIARLAQKARAAGLHLIIATQRPSVDVITGLIKANFPSRISFRVSSIHDSRTILGTIGAENLLGMGDMLIMPPGTSDLTRVHGAFVNDEDIHNIVDFLKSQGSPEYDEDIVKSRDEDEASGIDETEKDEVYDQAVAIVAEFQVCSISMLQRRLRIGYNRSARIVEIMEKEGIVGPANGVNKREVLISPH
jgi:S-DNA-T family DNA segregation ATPase FtsK/SpoIIIE